jgi:hypothetical protein
MANHWIMELEHQRNTGQRRIKDSRHQYNLQNEETRLTFTVRLTPSAQACDGRLMELVYYIATNANEKRYAKELHERIRREFPEASSTKPAAPEIALNGPTDANL